MFSESTVSGYIEVLEARFGVRLGTSALHGGALLLDGEEVEAGDLASLRGGRRVGAREARRDIAAGCWRHLDFVVNGGYLPAEELTRDGQILTQNELTALAESWGLTARFRLDGIVEDSNGVVIGRRVR